MKDNDRTSDKKKIILLNGSEIMRSMLIRALEGKGSMVIDPEIRTYTDLGKISVDGTSLDADWLISIETDSILSEEVMALMEQNPRTKLLILATDGSQVLLRWFEEKTRVIKKLDLPELMEILKNGQ